MFENSYWNLKINHLPNKKNLRINDSFNKLDNYASLGTYCFLNSKETKKKIVHRILRTHTKIRPLKKSHHSKTATLILHETRSDSADDQTPLRNGDSFSENSNKQEIINAAECVCVCVRGVNIFAGVVKCVGDSEGCHHRGVAVAGR